MHFTKVALYYWITLLSLMLCTTPLVAASAGKDHQVARSSAQDDSRSHNSSLISRLAGELLGESSSPNATDQQSAVRDSGSVISRHGSTLFKEIVPAESDNNPSQSIILLLGKEGAGKTTTLLYLLNAPMKYNEERAVVVNEEGDWPQGLDKGGLMAIVNNKDKQQTQRYNITISSDSDTVPKVLTFLDCPGFQEDSTKSAETLRWIAKLAHRENAIKAIACVVEYTTITSPQAFLGLTQSINSLLNGNMATYLPDIFWLVTKAPAGIDKESLITTITTKYERTLPTFWGSLWEGFAGGIGLTSTATNPTQVRSQHRRNPSIPIKDFEHLFLIDPCKPVQGSLSSDVGLRLLNHEREIPKAAFSRAKPTSTLSPKKLKASSSAGSSGQRPSPSIPKRLPLKRASSRALSDQLPEVADQPIILMLGEEPLAKKQLLAALLGYPIVDDGKKNIKLSLPKGLSQIDHIPKLDRGDSHSYNFAYYHLYARDKSAHSLTFLDCPVFNRKDGKHQQTLDLIFNFTARKPISAIAYIVNYSVVKEESLTALLTQINKHFQNTPILFLVKDIPNHVTGDSLSRLSLDSSLNFSPSKLPIRFETREEVKTREKKVSLANRARLLNAFALPAGREESPPMQASPVEQSDTPVSQQETAPLPSFIDFATLIVEALEQSNPPNLLDSNSSHQGESLMALCNNPFADPYAIKAKFEQLYPSSGSTSLSDVGQPLSVDSREEEQKEEVKQEQESPQEQLDLVKQTVETEKAALKAAIAAIDPTFLQELIQAQEKEVAEAYDKAQKAIQHKDKRQKVKDSSGVEAASVEDLIALYKTACTALIELLTSCKDLSQYKAASMADLEKQYRKFNPAIAAVVDQVVDQDRTAFLAKIKQAEDWIDKAYKDARDGINEIGTNFNQNEITFERGVAVWALQGYEDVHSDVLKKVNSLKEVYQTSYKLQEVISEFKKFIYQLEQNKEAERVVVDLCQLAWDEATKHAVSSYSEVTDPQRAAKQQEQDKASAIADQQGVESALREEEQGKERELAAKVAAFKALVKSIKGLEDLLAKVKDLSVEAQNLDQYHILLPAIQTNVEQRFEAYKTTLTRKKEKQLLDQALKRRRRSGVKSKSPSAIGSSPAHSKQGKAIFYCCLVLCAFLALYVQYPAYFSGLLSRLTALKDSALQAITAREVHSRK